MKELREYQIPFAGLKEGVHHFNYEIGDEFFSHFEGSQVTKARIFVDLTFDKKDRLFVLNFDIAGSMHADCDRCGQPFDMPLHGNYTIYVKLGDQREEDADSEDVIWIGDGESIIDITEIIYEFIHLAVPMHIVHQDNADGTPGCDPEILKLLRTSEEEKEDKDPRWDILNNLNQN